MVWKLMAIVLLFPVFYLLIYLLIQFREVFLQIITEMEAKVITGHLVCTNRLANPLMQFLWNLYPQFYIIRITEIYLKTESILHMVHAARLRLGRADESQTSYQRYVWEHLLHIGLYADAILDEHYDGMFMKQRRQKFWKQMIVGCFQSDNHHIALRHILRILIHINLFQMERTVAGIHLHAMLLDKLIITMQQKVYLLSAIRQLAAILAADGSYSNDSVTQHTLLQIPIDD